MRYKGRAIDEITVTATTPSFVDIGREKVEYGRYLNESDYQHNARVCVIGVDLVDKLFPNSDPLDKEILIAGLPFRVIGIIERQGSTFGQSQDNFAIVPLTTYRGTWMGRPELFVFIKAPDGPHMLELEDEVRAFMRVRRHVPWLWFGRRPGVLQRHRPIEYRRAGLRVDAVGDEVAVPLELEALLRLRLLQRGFELRA